MLSTKNFNFLCFLMYIVHRENLNFYFTSLNFLWLYIIINYLVTINTFWLVYTMCLPCKVGILLFKVTLHSLYRVFELYTYFCVWIVIERLKNKTKSDTFRQKVSVALRYWYLFWMSFLEIQSPNLKSLYCACPFVFKTD